ncbi:addiction module protein [Thiohalomonas denitrificans]|uniref:addiction module protein n=1 Tax=Thiohalomonas denitrificans TaxID=415747 RepID=UPI0026EF62A0|nr:addiction module protein [Thiohalomonas denitrificans]
MSLEELLKEALKLKPQDRFTMVDGLLRSLDRPDAEIDAIWDEEAEKRLQAYRAGTLSGIPNGAPPQ